jgi:hypothetical protein
MTEHTIFIAAKASVMSIGLCVYRSVGVTCIASPPTKHMVLISGGVDGALVRFESRHTQHTYREHPCAECSVFTG